MRQSFVHVSQLKAQFTRMVLHLCSQIIVQSFRGEFKLCSFYQSLKPSDMVERIPLKFQCQECTCVSLVAPGEGGFSR